jgi:hypothetical protein
MIEIGESEFERGVRKTRNAVVAFGLGVAAVGTEVSADALVAGLAMASAGAPLELFRLYVHHRRPGALTPSSE